MKWLSGSKRKCQEFLSNFNEYAKYVACAQNTSNFMPQVHWMFFGTLNEPFIKFKESYDIVHFSSTDSTIEVKNTFEHNLKQRKRKHYNKLTIVFSLVSTTQMQYRNDTSLFRETVLLVGGPRTL